MEPVEAEVRQMNDRQMKILNLLWKRGYMPLSLTDHLDPDIAFLIKEGYIEWYHANYVGVDMCHLTDKGRECLGKMKA